MENTSIVTAAGEVGSLSLLASAERSVHSSAMLTATLPQDGLTSRYLGTAATTSGRRSEWTIWTIFY